MTLFEAIQVLEAAATAEPAVNMIVRQDAFRLNGCPDARYGVFVWVQGLHGETPEDSHRTYTFTLFYIDRLTEDGGNLAAVQSTGVEVLSGVCRRAAENGLFAENLTFQPFAQRFTDECGGVFANVTFETIAGTSCDVDGESGRTVKIL